MRIIVNFLSGNSYWQDLVTQNAAVASERLSDPNFIAWIRSLPGFDNTYDTAAQVADKIENAGEVQINVGFYSSLFTRAIAYEADGGVYFNTRKEKYGAGSVGNIVHETMHAPPFNYQHNGNSPVGNQNTVPWRVGNEADTWTPTAGISTLIANGLTADEEHA